MAAVLGCDESTLTRRFAQVIKEGREQGKSSLKRKQYEVAMSGNVSMLIWLGKIRIGQIDQTYVLAKNQNVNVNAEVESSAVKEILADFNAIIDTKINERKS